MSKHWNVGDHAPNVAVLDVSGQPFELQQLWQTGPVMLSFLRHFG